MHRILPEKFIGITGGSCSGKTILSQNLIARFGDQIGLFSFDDMYIGHAALAGKNITDWEDPSLYRWDDFINCLKELKAGREITIVANESPERRVPEILHIQPRPIMVVIGFLVLHHPEVRKFFDETMYLDVPEDEIIRRRLARAVTGDYWNSAEYVTGGLIEGHRRIVVPQRELAKHVLDATRPSSQVADEAAAIIRGDTSHKNV